MIGLIVAMALGLLAARPLVGYMHTALAARTTAATAGELRQIADAAQQYVQANYASLETATTAGSGVTISVPTLEQQGYLSKAIAVINPYGQTWAVEILQPSPGQLQALVLSTGGSAIPEHQAPAIAAQTGQEGGFIPYQGQYGTLTPNIAEGAYGHWQLSLAGYTNPGPGHLAALLAFNAGNLENDYLYRVAEPGHPALNTMETALNMGANDINNANNINAAKGAITLGTTSTTACNPNARLHLAGSEVWDGCDGDLHLYPGGGNGGAVATSANMQVGGRLGTAGESATSGYPGGWSGGIHSWDIYANGSIGAGSNGGVSAWLQNNGYGGVTDTFSVGQRLELGRAYGQANPGWGCSPNGEIASNANGSGQLMVCTAGAWKAAGGGRAILTSVSNPSAGVNYYPPPYCPGGYPMTSYVRVSSYFYWNTLALCQQQ